MQSSGKTLLYFVALTEQTILRPCADCTWESCGKGLIFTENSEIPCTVILKIVWTSEYDLMFDCMMSTALTHIDVDIYVMNELVIHTTWKENMGHSGITNKTSVLKQLLALSKSQLDYIMSHHSVWQ